MGFLFWWLQGFSVGWKQGWQLSVNRGERCWGLSRGEGWGKAAGFQEALRAGPVQVCGWEFEGRGVRPPGVWLHRCRCGVGGARLNGSWVLPAECDRGDKGFGVCSGSYFNTGRWNPCWQRGWRGQVRDCVKVGKAVNVEVPEGRDSLGCRGCEVGGGQRQGRDA